MKLNFEWFLVFNTVDHMFDMIPDTMTVVDIPIYLQYFSLNIVSSSWLEYIQDENNIAQKVYIVQQSWKAILIELYIF